MFVLNLGPWLLDMLLWRQNKWQLSIFRRTENGMSKFEVSFVFMNSIEWQKCGVERTQYPNSMSWCTFTNDHSVHSKCDVRVKNNTSFLSSSISDADGV